MELESVTRRYKRNIGSISTIIYAIPHEDVQTFPALPAVDADMKDAAKMVGNLVPKDGKGFIKLRATMDTPGIVGEKQGEMDGISFKQKLAFLIAGLDDANLGFCAKALNSGWVFIGVDPNRADQLFILGNEVFAAEAETGEDAGTGNATADRAGINYNYYSVGYAPVYLYTGTHPKDMLLEDESGS